MRDDLLQAKACVDWAVSNLPALNERLSIWVEENVEVVFKDPDPNGADYVVVALHKEPMPLVYNVEVGAYINAIRSSLDILATALAYRYSIPKPDKMYFPVADSEATFNSGKGFKGSEFVKALPAPERAIIEGLKGPAA